MRTAMLVLLIVTGPVIGAADDGAGTPAAALKNARNAAEQSNWVVWAETLTPECQRVLVIDLTGFLISAAHEARKAGISDKKVDHFEREVEGALDEWIGAGTAINIVREMARELGRDDYRPSHLDLERLTAFARTWEMPTKTVEDRMACRILVYTLEMLAEKRWEKISDEDAEQLDESFSEATLESIIEKGFVRLESRWKEESRSIPDLVSLNLLADLEQMRSEKCRLARLFGPLAEMIPDVLRLCRLIERDCEPIHVITSGSLSELSVGKDSATALLTLENRSATREIGFRRIGGHWKIDSLGYGRWLSARYEPPRE